jgi:geranylgeranyl pyrophosphate synthase
MEAALKLNALRSVVDLPQMNLGEAIDYALHAQGSGVRRALAIGVGAASQMRPADGRVLAEAIESFHHASLILDDLPCMDDADERRGRACLHRVAGEDQAVLVALALINRAYTDCWAVAARYPKRTVMAARLVASCMGERGILDGQSRDLYFRPGRGASEVRAIAVQKTGMLLKLALLLPALLGGADWRILLQLARLANDWGRLYQAIDDFSDMCLSGESTGKTPFRDLQNARPNLVVALGPETAVAELVMLEERAACISTGLARRDSAWELLEHFHARLGEKTMRIRVAMEAA